MNWKELLKADREVKKAPFGMGDKRKAKKRYQDYLKMVTGLVAQQATKFPDKNIAVYFVKSRSSPSHLVDMFKKTNNTAVMYMISVADQLEDAKTLGISDDKLVSDIKEAMKQAGVTLDEMEIDGQISRPAAQSRSFPQLKPYHFMLQTKGRYKYK